LLQFGAHREQHFADEIVLGREVVDDDPIADPEPLRDPPSGELAQPVGERRGERALENLGLAVLVAHFRLIVVITAINVS
jgi:hypothetical protein